MEVFSIKSNLKWLERIPSFLNEIYFGKMIKWDVINEIHNTFKHRFFRRVLSESKHVGVWGWNSWCGIHTFALLVGGKKREILRNTIDVGFNNLENETKLLPHAVIHRNDIFASEPTYKCYSGENNEDYNIDNILCWAKMAMEYFLLTHDTEWFNKMKFQIIENSIIYILQNKRDKYNKKLINVGIEGDWTECTDWDLDNSNVNVNMLRTIQLIIESKKLLLHEGIEIESELNYPQLYKEIFTNFNKSIKDGGFWSAQLGYYIHGNNGNGTIVHGDKYFESTVNYFSILWNIAPENYKERIFEYIDKNQDKIERPYPVLTNYLPRTGARRKNYGKTVTNGDIWFVLGGHAAASRLQNNFIDDGSEMFKIIMDYEKEHGVIHNCVYQDGTTNDSWDPEVANYGAPFAVLVLGVLGLKYSSEGVIFNIKPLKSIEYLNLKIFIYDKIIELKIKWQMENFLTCKIAELNQSLEPIAELEISSNKFIILYDNELKISEIQN